MTDISVSKVLYVLLVMNSYIITAAASMDHFIQIVALQNLNLPQSLTTVEAQNEGFVTLSHTIEQLQKMNYPYPHIIALHKDQIVGYLLVLLKEYQPSFLLLSPILDILNSIIYKGIRLGDAEYFLMCQVCLSKEVRGSGLFLKMYDKMVVQMKEKFEYMVTVISKRNRRSIKAHKKIGFMRIDSEDDLNRDWIIVLKELS